MTKFHSCTCKEYIISRWFSSYTCCIHPGSLKITSPSSSDHLIQDSLVEKWRHVTLRGHNMTLHVRRFPAEETIRAQGSTLKPNCLHMGTFFVPVFLTQDLWPGLKRNKYKKGLIDVMWNYLSLRFTPSVPFKFIQPFKHEASLILL